MTPFFKHAPLECHCIFCLCVKNIKKIKFGPKYENKYWSKNALLSHNKHLQNLHSWHLLCYPKIFIFIFPNIVSIRIWNKSLISFLKFAYQIKQIFNRPGVAWAVLQSPPSLLNWFIEWSFSSESSRHC